MQIRLTLRHTSCSLQHSTIITRKLLILFLAMTSATALQSDIVVVGLNAAYQKRFVLEPTGPNPALIPGSVHRASEISEGVGGKGQDVAISLSCLGMTSNNVKLAQFIGEGGEGESLLSIIGKRLGGSDGVASDLLTVRTRSRMRTCTTIVSADCSTELVEPSGKVTPEELSDMMAKIDHLGKKSGALCFMGSMPPGCGPNTYSDLAARIISGDSNTLTLIDSVVGLSPLIKTLSSIKQAQKSCRGGNILKINVSELCKLANTLPKNEADCATSSQIREALDGFLELYEGASEALDYIALTDGKYPAHLIDLSSNSPQEEFDIYRIKVADLHCIGGTNDLASDKRSTILYPIGAGDTVSAGTLAAWKFLVDKQQNVETTISLNERVASILQSRYVENGGNIVAESFAFGLACATASCLQVDNSIFKIEDAIQVYQGMQKPSKI